MARNGRRTAFLVGGTALAVVTGVAGCGAAEKLSAKDTVTDAITKIGESSSVSFTVTLDSTVADLKKLDETGSVSPSDTKVMQQVLDGELTIASTAPDGKTLGSLMTPKAASSGDLKTMLSDPDALKTYLQGQGDSAITLKLSGSALFELRSVGTTLYARADVPKVLELADQDPSQLDAMTGQLPPALAPVAKAAKGEWIAVDMVEAVRSLKSTGLLDRLPTQQVPTGTDPKAALDLVTALRASMQEHGRITELGEDGERGTGYRLTAPVKAVADDITDELLALAGDDAAADLQKQLKATPERDVNVELWVKDDVLTGVRLDLAQFAEKPVDAKATIDIAIDTEVEPVTAPKGANTLDVAEALIGLGGLSAGRS
jgi:hypothetical protein